MAKEQPTQPTQTKPENLTPAQQEARRQTAAATAAGQAQVNPMVAAALGSQIELQQRAAENALPKQGIFDEAKAPALGAADPNQRHTFGQWARAKGVTVRRVRELMAAGKLGAMDGDGPEMTESEFDEAVDFRLQGTMPNLPPMTIHRGAENTAGAPPRPQAPPDDEPGR